MVDPTSGADHMGLGWKFTKNASKPTLSNSSPGLWWCWATWALQPNSSFSTYLCCLRAHGLAVRTETWSWVGWGLPRTTYHWQKLKRRSSQVGSDQVLLTHKFTHAPDLTPNQQRTRKERPWLSLCRWVFVSTTSRRQATLPGVTTLFYYMGIPSLSLQTNASSEVKLLMVVDLLHLACSRDPMTHHHTPRNRYRQCPWRSLTECPSLGCIWTQQLAVWDPFRPVCCWLWW